GFVLGLAAAKATVPMLNRLKLESEGLYPVLSIALVLLLFGLTQLIGGSGFLAVYVMGLLLGGANFIHKKSLTLFHKGVAWPCTITMFLALGLLVLPSHLLRVAGHGFLLSLFLIFVARPLAVTLSLSRSPFAAQHKALISWV